MFRGKTIGLLLVTAAALLASVLMAAPAEATGNEHYYYYSHASGPCPSWSIQDVLDDPGGDWDRDRVSNADEIYVAGGLNPCRYDSTKFCELQPASCTGYARNRVYHRRPVVTICSGGYWNWNAVSASPSTDWDADGITNLAEANAGANPCTKPCPVTYQIDVALNPWGDWDGDGRSNVDEFHAGTDPCRYNGYVYTRPAPRVTTTTTTTQRLPHVGGPAPTVTYTPPAPTVNPCPAGYPYYHSENGQCYANPVPAPTGW